MGYNRSGTRRKQRLKRAKKHEERLARKASADTVAEGTKGARRPGAPAAVKQSAAPAVADAVKGKKETPKK